MNLLLLTPEEKETIILRREKTMYFRQSGDSSVYMLPPCIILGSGGNYDNRIDIPEKFTITGKLSRNAYSTYMDISEMESIHQIQRSLELPEMDTGLSVSLDLDSKIPFNTELRTIRMKHLMLVDLDGNEMKVIRTRPLKRR